jgi:hypothetical protein
VPPPAALAHPSANCGDLHILRGTDERVAVTRQRDAPGDEPAEPLVVGGGQRAGGYIVMPAVRVDRAEDPVVAQHRVPAELADIDQRRHTRLGHAGQAHDPVGRAAGERAGSRSPAGALDHDVDSLAGSVSPWLNGAATRSAWSDRDHVKAYAAGALDAEQRSQARSDRQ